MTKRAGIQNNWRSARRTVCIVAVGIMLALCIAIQSALADDTWPDGIDCSLCHTEETEEIDETQHAIVDCSICHDDDEKLAEIHDAADDDTALPTKLKKTTVDDSVCLECHGDGGIAAPVTDTEDVDADLTDDDTGTDDDTDAAIPDDAIETDDAAETEVEADDVEETETKADADVTDETAAEAEADDAADEEDAEAEEEVRAKTQLIAATADCDVLTDIKGTVVNPHDLPDTSSHNKIACVDCHTIHDAEADPDATASKKCQNCHHENVYECYTCHS